MTLPQKKTPAKASSTQASAPGDIPGTTPGQLQQMDTTPAPTRQQGPSKPIRQPPQATQQRQPRSTLRGVSRGSVPRQGPGPQHHQQDVVETLLPLPVWQALPGQRNRKTGLSHRKGSEGEEEASLVDPPFPAPGASLELVKGADLRSEAQSLWRGKGVCQLKAPL